jgi:hypothetical protein
LEKNCLAERVKYPARRPDAPRSGKRRRKERRRPDRHAEMEKPRLRARL